LDHAVISPRRQHTLGLAKARGNSKDEVQQKPFGKGGFGKLPKRWRKSWIAGMTITGLSGR